MSKKIKPIIIISSLIALTIVVSNFLGNETTNERTSIVDGLLENTPVAFAVDTPPQKQQSGNDTAYDTTALSPPSKKEDKNEKEEAKEATVLICNSKNSYAYHNHRCSGLNRCKAGIESLTKTQAENQGKRPCKFCY